MDAGAAPVVLEAGGVLELPDRQMGLQGGEVGAVDVQGGDLVPAGREFGARPLGAGLPDLVGALRGLLAQDVGDPRVADDVVPRALAGLVEQDHRVRDSPLEQGGGCGIDVSAVLLQRLGDGLADQIRRVRSRRLDPAPDRHHLHGCGRGCGRVCGRPGGRAVGGVQVLGEPGHLVVGGVAAQHAGLRGRERADVVGLGLGIGLGGRSLRAGVVFLRHVRCRRGTLFAPGVQLGPRALQEVGVLLPDFAAGVAARLPAADRRRAHSQRTGDLCTGQAQPLSQGAPLLGGGQRHLLPGRGQQRVDGVEVRHRPASSCERDGLPLRAARAVPRGARRRAGGRSSQARVGPASRSRTGSPKCAARPSQSSSVQAVRPA